MPQLIHSVVVAPLVAILRGQGRFFFGRGPNGGAAVVTLYDLTLERDRVHLPSPRPASMRAPEPPRRLQMIVARLRAQNADPGLVPDG